MGQITAQRIIDLKAKVKAECQRRKYTSGRIDNTYGSAAYDFTTTPTIGGLALQEQHDKISIPLSAINSDNVPANTSPAHQLIKESEIANMEAWVTAWSKIDKYASDSGCKTSCTGLCSGCTACTSCSGCSGCSGGCDGCTGCTGCGIECSHDCETICS